ncbi:hypothetical protein TPY_2749 [Sulfobacillus acidophilus TPY]|nr:hypothetical protein TPY_2749 [Sulfobacillus acidophilus TPY]
MAIRKKGRRDELTVDMPKVLSQEGVCWGNYEVFGPPFA